MVETAHNFIIVIVLAIMLVLYFLLDNQDKLKLS